jgi:hypothetical protein
MPGASSENTIRHPQVLMADDHAETAVLLRMLLANWEAEQEWTARLIFSVSKVALLGKRPVNFAVGAGPTIASPDGGADWRFRLVATFLFPR